MHNLHFIIHFQIFRLKMDTGSERKISKWPAIIVTGEIPARRYAKILSYFLDHFAAEQMLAPNAHFFFRSTVRSSTPWRKRNASRPRLKTQEEQDAQRKSLSFYFISSLVTVRFLTIKVPLSKTIMLIISLNKVSRTQLPRSIENEQRHSCGFYFALYWRY